MARTCNNCDHRKLCEEWWRSDMSRDIKEMQKVWGDGCEHWSGWLSTEDELPTKSCDCIVIFEDGEHCICEFSSEYNDFGNTVIEVHNELDERPIERWFEAFEKDDVILAWREVPKWEGSTV